MPLENGQYDDLYVGIHITEGGGQTVGTGTGVMEPLDRGRRGRG